MSTNNVRCASSAKQAARLIAVVVFPTPPFWFAIAIILLRNLLDKSITYKVLTDLLSITTNFYKLEALFRFHVKQTIISAKALVAAE
jgi:hypothetical protein